MFQCLGFVRCSAWGSKVAYTVPIGVTLGPTYTGLALKAQLVTTAGANSGSAITTGFVELSAGSGDYLWLATIADDFVGAVKFLKVSDSSYLASLPIYPPELNPFAAQVPGSFAAGSAGAALGRITAAALTVVSPVAESGDVSVIYGDDYTVGSGNGPLEWESVDWPNLTTGALLFSLQLDAGRLWPKVPVALSATRVRLELTAAETMDIRVGRFDYDIQVTIAGVVTTLLTGVFTVTGDAR